MKIIGYRRSDFVTKEGRPVTGCRIYLATEIASQNGSIPSPKGDTTPSPVITIFCLDIK